ncbi:MULTISPECIES: hypothetical protein [Psychrobacter]|uniref:hypothetical protein n=1 Tax=Psychrobacter TaxID=497 RepID=UPI000ED2A1F7|nr:MULTISPECIES: hypothetical protein [Psychrobacter]HCR87611.1 hypothetical protein [Psychrobacter sp.]
MLVKLFWTDRWNNGDLYPEGIILENSSNIKGLIFNLLNDDGGLGLSYLGNWMDEGLKEIKKVKQGSLNFYDMWGQSWGAEVRKDEVLIYWGYDDTELEETMNFSSFYKILTNWMILISKTPCLETEMLFEC